MRALKFPTVEGAATVTKKRSASVVMVLLLSASVQSGAQPQCGEKEQGAVDAVVKRLQWLQLWEPSGAYPTGSKVTLHLFFGRSSVGFCSKDLERCMEFHWDTAGRLGLDRRPVVQFAAQDIGKQIETYLQMPTAIVYESTGDPGPASNFRTPTGEIIRVPTASMAPPKRKPEPPESYRFCWAVVEKLPPVGFPAPTRRKLPDSVKELADSYQRSVADWYRTMGQRLEYVIPFFEQADPLVYVLSRTDGQSKSVHVWSNLNPGWERSHVMTDQFVPAEFYRVVRLIESGQAMVVK